MKNQTAQNVSVTESLTRTWWKNATSDVKTINESVSDCWLDNMCKIFI